MATLSVHKKFEDEIREAASSACRPLADWPADVPYISPDETEAHLKTILEKCMALGVRLAEVAALLKPFPWSDSQHSLFVEAIEEEAKAAFGLDGYEGSVDFTDQLAAIDVMVTGAFSERVEQLLVAMPGRFAGRA